MCVNVSRVNLHINIWFANCTQHKKIAVSHEGFRYFWCGRQELRLWRRAPPNDYQSFVLPLCKRFSLLRKAKRSLPFAAPTLNSCRYSVSYQTKKHPQGVLICLVRSTGIEHLLATLKAFVLKPFSVYSPITPHTNKVAITVKKLNNSTLFRRCASSSLLFFVDFSGIFFHYIQSIVILPL